MTARLSNPIESLIQDSPPEEIFHRVDVAIVGSGYGASIAAACLAGRDRTVAVLERGREYAPGDFPVDLGHVPRHVRFQRADGDDAVGYPDALFDLRLGETMDVLVGNGMGGTSLINANVAVQPDPEDFRDAAWPHDIRSDPRILDPWFAQAATLLRVGPSAATETDKYRALSVLAGALRQKCEATRLDPAPVTVTFDKSRENAEIPQPPCTKCGNCVTGCNVGAKNTLMMTALPHARARGAHLFTGATVLSVMPSDDTGYPWIIRLRRTASEKTPLQDEVFHLAARDVILAAGTLGSTEILLRSRDLHGLKVSGLLGKRFSGNGDAIAFGFAQRDRVHSIGMSEQHGAHDVGPTISGMVRTRVCDEHGRWQKLTIEDASVPTSIGALFGELLATGALLHRLDNPKLPAWYGERKGVDPISVASGAIEHSQILLVMGDDGAGGTMQLRPARQPSLDRARLVVDWPSVGNNPALRAADALLKQHDRAPGLDGGQYVPNPFWRPMPEQAGSVMSGPVPAGRAITVHPLGGCGMGDDIRTGVVNGMGQVFKDDAHGNGTAVHDGLHVMDGSIIPKALGINPLLTIAALSWRAADHLRNTRQWKPATECTLAGLRMSKPAVTRSPALQPTHLVLREQLIGTVKSVPEWLTAIHPRTQRWAEDKGLILRVEMDVPNLEQWLEAGTQKPLTTKAQLYFNRLDAATTRRLHRVHTPEEDLTPETRIAEGDGEVVLLKPDEVSWLVQLARTVLALWAYYRRRQPFRDWWAGVRKRFHRESPPSQAAPATPRVGIVKKLFKFFRLGWEFARYRRLKYTLTFRRGDDLLFTLEGEKVLAWRMSAPRLWDALLNLPLTLRAPRGDAVEGEIAMDMTHLVTTGTPQVKASPHLPATVVGLSRLGMLFSRAILQTHFWEFGAPNYPDELIPPPSEPPVLKVGDRQIVPERAQLWVPLREGGDGIRLWLTRYRHADPAAEPVLLIHGLAQGSLIYSTDSVEPNMAAAMSAAGFDVWLLDYRLSNMLPDPVPQGDWSMDEIARYDIPAAVAHVYNACSDRPVRIFAHCVGATSVAMAILKGWLKVAGTQKNLVKCVAFNAIHPWTMPSSVNEFRARFGSFFRDVLGSSDLLDPVPVPQPTATQVLFDRLAFSVARYDEEGGDHRRSRRTEDPATVCDRMTFLYGRMWRHMNLDPRTHQALPTLMGPGAGDVYRQLYYFARHERLTDHEGRNAYLTEANIRDNWMRIPTFFLHGEESMVFNPQSAERSAIRLDAIINLGVPPERRTPVRLLRVPGFGHMDVVFAKDAHRTVYSVLKTFFAKPWDREPLGDPLVPDHDPDPRHLDLTAGPVLRAAWIDDQRKIRIRLWAETDDEATSLVNGVRLVGENVKELVNGQWPVDPEELRYRMLDAVMEHDGDVAFSLKPRIGPGAVKKEPHILKAIADEVVADTYDCRYPDTMPWRKRLRAADAATPCRDMRFLVGSCRYPGTPFECEASDAIFGGMVPHIEGTAQDLPGAHMLFLIGDQIYADATANILESSAKREGYGERYRLAFRSRNARNVLAHVPTHFAIDDHEIADNWSGEAPGGPPRPPLAHAMPSARAFLSSERERHEIDPRQKWQNTALWYSLSEKREHCCPAFVMDTRSERELRLFGVGPHARLVSDRQFGALAEWLTAAHQGPWWSDMPKFIFTGVGIAPIPREFARCGETWRSQDGWSGYPRTLSEILWLILREQIRNVVFVSGDLHLSSASRLTLHREGIPDMVAWQVVSSGLYAPMPFANAQPADYDWNTPVRLPDEAGYDVEVTAESGLLCSGRSHFLRIDAERRNAKDWSLSIGVGGAGDDGMLLEPGKIGPPGFVKDGRRWRVDF